MQRDQLARRLRQRQLARIEPAERRGERRHSLLVARALVHDDAERALHLAQATAQGRALERLVGDLDPELVTGAFEQLEHDFWLHDPSHTIRLDRRCKNSVRVPDRARSSKYRDRHAKCRSTEIGTGHRNLPTMLVDDIANKWETEAGPLAIRRGREERLEDPLAVLFADPRPRVADLDEGGGQIEQLRADDLPGPRLDRVDRVRDQVDQHLLELTRDGLDHGELGVEVDLEPDVAALEQVLDARHRLAHDR